MDGAATELIHSAAGFGAEWFVGILLVLVVAFFGWRLTVIFEKRSEAQLKIEQKREERKAEEAKAHAAHEREMAEIKGNMVATMSETNVLMSALKTLMEKVVLSNETLHHDLEKSQMGSRELKEDVKEVKQKVGVLYDKGR